MIIFIAFLYTACVTFRTDGRPVCCPYYFFKNNNCEGMFYFVSKFRKKVFVFFPLKMGYAQSLILAVPRDCCLIFLKRFLTTLRLAAWWK